MGNDNTSREKMIDALKMLDEAADQKKDELKSLVSDKYKHLRRMIAETESEMADSLSNAKDASCEKAHEISRDANRSFHRNTKLYLTIVAAVCILLGYLLGRG